jgi:hypothetical protein
MVDGSKAAASMFDDMVELAEQWLARHEPGHSQDPRAYAAVLVAMQTGLLALHEHLSRALGMDILAPEGHLRMSRALIDFYSSPLMSPELAAQARAAFERVERLQATQPRNPAGPTAAQGAE